MKKKLLLTLLLVSTFIFLFVFASSAATPNMYVEFQVKLDGGSDYVTAYVENTEQNDPRVNFNLDFYKDVEFTEVIDKSEIVGIDLSNSVVYGAKRNYVNRITAASDPSVYASCEEIKWFSSNFTTTPNNTFKGWTGLKSFDFGCITVVDYGFLASTALESVVIPEAVTKLNNGVFQNCTSLKSVKFEGAVTSIGSNQFAGCTSLTDVDLGEITVLSEKMFDGCTSLKSVTIPSTVATINTQVFYNCTALESVTLPNNLPTIGKGMFYNCASLSSIELPSTIDKINDSAFRGCKALTSIDIPEGVTYIGVCAFYQAGITSLHIPSTVTSLGYQVAEESAITSLTFAKNSQLTYIDHRAFMSCKSLEGVVILPDGLETIDYGLFSSCTKLRAVKMPNTVTTLEGNGILFSGCSSLEFVQLSNQLTWLPNSMFENCSKLKAISLPDSIEITYYKALRNCASLQAVYLPKNLVSLGQVNSSASDWGTFYQSPNVYLVNEPFEVFDGDTLLGDNFVMPARPEVYYMPSGLTTVGNSEFQGCTSLNDYIVFPEGVTKTSGSNQGPFYNVGSKKHVTFVYLGDMEEVRIRQNDSSYSNISFVFVNENDKDLNDVSLVIGAANNKALSNSLMYFCSSGTVYDLSTFVAKNGAVYNVLETDFTKTVHTAETQPHFTDPRLTVKTDPTCEVGIAVRTYCFCGAENEIFEEEGTALGHSHTVFLEIVYQSYLESGYYSYKCERCDDVNNEKTIGPLFGTMGYSTPEDGSAGISIAYRVYEDAINEYEAATGESVEYGVFAVLKERLGENDIFNESGEAASGVIAAEISSHGFINFGMKISGFTEAQKSKEFALGAFVCIVSDTSREYSYIQETSPNEGEKYSFISFNDYISPQN